MRVVWYGWDGNLSPACKPSGAAHTDVAFNGFLNATRAQRGAGQEPCSRCAVNLAPAFSNARAWWGRASAQRTDASTRTHTAQQRCQLMLHLWHPVRGFSRSVCQERGRTGDRTCRAYVRWHARSDRYGMAQRIRYRIVVQHGGTFLSLHAARDAARRRALHLRPHNAQPRNTAQHAVRKNLPATAPCTEHRATTGRTHAYQLSVKKINREPTAVPHRAADATLERGAGKATKYKSLRLDRGPRCARSDHSAPPCPLAHLAKRPPSPCLLPRPLNHAPTASAHTETHTRTLTCSWRNSCRGPGGLAAILGLQAKQGTKSTDTAHQLMTLGCVGCVCMNGYDQNTCVRRHIKCVCVCVMVVVVGGGLVPFIVVYAETVGSAICGTGVLAATSHRWRRRCALASSLLPAPKVR